MLLFNLALPVFGYIFTVWLVYYLRVVKYDEVLQDASILNLEEFDSSFVKVQRVFGEGSMLELMTNEYAPSSLKLKALVSMSDDISQKNIEIIKKSLSSSDDEIRLLSFAIIDKIERGINGKIYIYLERYENEKDEYKRADYAKELAALYWEMVYYELSDDVLKEYLLEKVKFYLHIALKLYFDDVHLHISLGRVYMLEEKYELAATEFTFAIENDNENFSYIIPYLAEIQFNLGNYRIVQSLMQRAEGLDTNTTLYPIVKQWNEAS